MFKSSPDQISNITYGCDSNKSSFLSNKKKKTKKNPAKMKEKPIFIKITPL